MNDKQTSRRRFLLASVAFSTAAVSGHAWLRSSKAWAFEEDADALAQLARRLFPHEGLSDAVYVDVMDGVLTSLANNPNTADLLTTAEAALNEQQDGDWFELDEAAQIAAIVNIQDKAFFATILGAARGAFYYNPRVWEHIDYPGSSKEHGGYKFRGFNDIDWLPEESS
ncbi:MAG: hypothetical protein ACR2QZ_16825 [Woeseiaceae bacterium]